MASTVAFQVLRAKRWIGVCAGAAVLAIAPHTPAQDALYYAGQTTSGQPIIVELASLSAAEGRQVNFVYALGNQRLSSQAQCLDSATTGFWTTLDDGVVRSPQSPATENMLTIVCSYADPTANTRNIQTALVFDPPSNVRDAPNGNVICEVSASTTISTYGNSGSWYYTDACGRAGVIDSSQIQF